MIPRRPRHPSTTAVEARSDQRRSAARWTVRARWLIALIATALQLIGVLLALGSVPELLSANPITASIETDQQRHAVGQDSSGGTAFIDDAHVTATRTTAEVHDAATWMRVGLAFARTGLQGVTWHGAAGLGRIGVGPRFTFQFGWLAAAIGLLAIAAVVVRSNDDPSPSTP